MTKRDFSLLVMRLMAIWVITGSFGHLSRFVMGWGALVPCVLQMGWGIFLWMFAEPLARMLMDERNEEASIASWSVREAARLGLVLIGFGLLAQGISPVGNFVLQVLIGGLHVGLVAFTFSGMAQLICGAILIFGARVLSYWLAPREVFASTSDSS